MAIAVIGGLLVSTFLSLLFVPAFFTIMDDLGRLSARLFSRFIGPSEEPEAPMRRSIAVKDTHGERHMPDVRPAPAKVPEPASNQELKSRMPPGLRPVLVTITLIGFDMTGGLCGT